MRPGRSRALHVRRSEKPAEPPLFRSRVVVTQKNQVVSVDDGVRGDRSHERAREREDGSEAQADDARPRDPNPAARSAHLMGEPEDHRLKDDALEKRSEKSAKEEFLA